LTINVFVTNLARILWKEKSKRREYLYWGVWDSQLIYFRLVETQNWKVGNSTSNCRRIIKQELGGQWLFTVFIVAEIY